MDTCKGHTTDGTPCEVTVLFENGYCYRHQDQAPGESLEWTRKRLEAVIEAHGGPEGLDLFLANLQGAELSYANLQGAVLYGANLQGVMGHIV